jgi:hypothetical protein
MGTAVRTRLLSRTALGASRSLGSGRWAWLAGKARKDAPGPRVAGEPTAWPRAGDIGLVTSLRARVKALGASGIERLDVLAVGGIREDALLAHLVTGRSASRWRGAGWRATRTDVWPVAWSAPRARA